MRFILLLLVVLCSSQVCRTENQTFTATKEWQQIREGQGIPPGLHVRINLQTGKKEAKLLDEDEQPQDAAGALSLLPENVEKTPPKGTAKHKLKLSKTLTDALKQLPREQLGIEYTPERLEHIKRSYQSYEQLKESYADLKHSFKSDAEIISLLLQDYRNVSQTPDHKDDALPEQGKTNDLLRILENFNYLVHQIDNALWFIDAGGLDTVLLPMIVNQTEVTLRVQSMRVLGALTQNNPKAQIKVFERNFGSHLAQVLISSTHTAELSTALYAFGSLLRKFPLAQLRILSLSGIQALVAVLAKECELKIKAKAVTLINDVIVEQQSVLASSADAESDALALAQYAQLNLSEWLLAHDYCDTLDVLISSKMYEFIEQPDLAEYFVQALANTQSFCDARWSQSPQLRHTLLTLKNRFGRSEDEYRVEIAQSIEQVVRQLYETAGQKDEL